MHAEEQYLLPVIEAGGSGYVLKTGADSELIEAIRVVHRDEVFLYPSAAKLLLGKYLERGESGDVAYDGLTPREREVLRPHRRGLHGPGDRRHGWSQPEDRGHLPPAGDGKTRTSTTAPSWSKYALRKGLLQARRAERRDAPPAPPAMTGPPSAVRGQAVRQTPTLNALFLTRRTRLVNGLVDSAGI